MIIYIKSFIYIKDKYITKKINLNYKQNIILVCLVQTITLKQQKLKSKIVFLCNRNTVDMIGYLCL